MSEENDTGGSKRGLLGMFDTKVVQQKVSEDIEALKKPTKK